MERILVVAHRGASREAPENSLRAVRRARDAGADAIEVDVRHARGGELVVFHDDDLRRFGRDARVADLSLSELRSYDLGGGERVPTLDEVLEESAPDLIVNVELKVDRLRSEGLERGVVRCVRRHGAQARVIASSFSPLALVWIHALAAEVRTGFLFHGGQSGAWRRAWPRLARPDALHPQHSLVDAAFMKWALDAGFRVHPWTCDDEAQMRRLVALGVHGIITNRPERLRAVLDGGAR